MTIAFLSFSISALALIGCISFHFSNLIIDPCAFCETIDITLENDALESHGERVGLYEKSSQVNGRPSWSSTSQAIWFVDSLNRWAIGDLEDIGTITAGIANKKEVSQCPFDLPSEDWMYTNNGWKAANANEINIVCVEEKV